MQLVGDFETTTDINDVRVWAWCLVNIDNIKVEGIGTSIESFFDFIDNKHHEIYYHNLKFDGAFIIHYLLSNGWKHSDSKEEKTFQTLITDDGLFYSITLYYKKFKKRYNKITFYDSLKKLPFPVSDIAKAFNLEETKGEIDYKAYRPKDHVLTEEEKEYIINDCVIVAKALKHQFSEGLTRMTVGSDALGSFKSIIGKHRFNNYFPVLPLEVDDDIRRAYKGGYTYLNPRFKEKRLQGCVFDVNSLYPYVMYEKLLPFGYPLTFEGKYKQDNFYPLYIQHISCEFELKKGYLPTIQLKNNKGFIPNEYLENSNGEIVDLTLTNVDLELFLKHYNVYNLEYHNGYMFKGITAVFKKYIDYWAEIKANSTGGLRTLAKLMLNSLYGKFATNPRSKTKTPYLKNNIVKYHTEDEEIRKPVYTAMGAFITAYAREKTIRTAQDNIDRFIYADTDSLHLIGYKQPNIDIHPSKLGAWKYEGNFTDSKFLRAKTYLETINGELQVKCAGMPKNVKKLVTYDNFKFGQSFAGKLTPKAFEGGIVLMDTDFTIKT